MMTNPINRLKQRGFSLVSAIFLLVVIAMLGAFAVTVSNSQHQSDAMDVMGKRTYQAARAGIEWGTYQITQSAVSPAFATACQTAAGKTQSLTLFSVYTVNVTCSTGGASYDDNGPVWVYTLISKANTTASPGGPDYFERQLTATIAQ
jgi:MSHA biogenesis protein MshP